ncbi:MAG: DUF192 domain-containing protein [Armatimonadota bacterium]
MSIVDLRNGRKVAGSVIVARSLRDRLIGLIGTRTQHDQALLITNCRQVHTFFMRFPIDVVWVDARCRVICVAENVPPWRVTGYCRRARHAVELASGTVERTGMLVGDDLRIDEFEG